MSNRIYRPSPKKAQQIIEEIKEKKGHYESKMAPRLNLWTEAAEMYSGKSCTRLENSKVSPNSAELYKAVRAKANMMYRMLTGRRPFFELEPMDILGFTDKDKLVKAEHYITMSLEDSNFDRGLYRALVMVNLYGSVAIHEQYEPIRSSLLGQKRFITSYRPVSLINCAFSLDAYDIQESGWKAISDVQSKTVLNRILAHDPSGKLYDTLRINKALNQEKYQPEVNQWVNQRMAWSGYTDGDFTGGIERTHYYGNIDCMNDGEEYAVDVVNNEFIIRMESYEGLCPVRVATVDTIDVEPLGNGMADKFGNMLGQLDTTRSNLLNTITLAGANMFMKQKGTGDEDLEFSVRQLGILNLESPSLQSISPDPRTVSSLAAYENSLIQQFRTAAGAPDILQAVVTGDATATENSLSMNEAVRNISVEAEMLSRPLVEDHIKVVLQNGQRYQTKPFTVMINKAPIQATPSDLMIDVNVRVKSMTDQDFRPSKINRLMAAAQLMINVPKQATPGLKTNAAPTILEVLRLLDVPEWDKSVSVLTEEDLLQMQLMAQLEAGPQAKPPTTTIPTAGRPTGVRTTETIKTPVGEVLQPPGTQQDSLDAIDTSNSPQ